MSLWMQGLCPCGAAQLRQPRSKAVVRRIKSGPLPAKNPKPFDFGFLPGGAKGTRTPDPHTASVVRYQLRHSPRCQSKLHHRHRRPKTARQESSPVDSGPSGKPDASRDDESRVSGASIHPKLASTRMTPLTVNAHPKDRCSAS